MSGRIPILLALVAAGCGRLSVPEDGGADGGADAAVAAVDGGLDGGSDGGRDAGADAGSDAGCFVDDDGDGYLAAACGGDDCDDGDPAVHPGATERCDGVDEDCDGVVDGAEADAWCGGPGAPPHTVGPWACEAGACAFAACEEGWLDCGPAPGCEIDPSSDRDHCGECGRFCRWSECVDAACDDVVELAAGPASTCARSASGRVLCWGWSSSGQLGDGTTTDRARPGLVSGLADASRIDLGNGTACAAEATGGAVCWGSGPIGDGSAGMAMTPRAVSDVDDAVDAATGVQHSCVLRASGAVSCWGDDVGTGTGSTRVPLPVSGVADAVSIEASVSRTCTALSSGSVMCWGRNDYGSLGDGSSGGARGPGPSVVGLTDAVEVALGSAHVCARRDTGEVACWGWDAYGQLGDGRSGDGVSSALPVAVLGLTDAVEIEAGGEDTCARRATGALVCWGRSYGASPAPVPGLGPVAEVTVGAGFACALLASSEVLCWGDNAHGQLGDGTMTMSSTPVSVLPL